MFTGKYDLRLRTLRKAPFIDPDAPIHPLQEAWEFAYLLKEFERLQPTRVCEIGPWTGGSLYQFMKRMQPGSKILEIDLPGCDPHLAQAEIDAAYKAWPEWAKRFNIDLRVCTTGSRSEEARMLAWQFLGGEIDFLFIDGDHRYEAVKSDFETFGPLVRPGGLIVLHDLREHLGSGHEYIGVYKLWEEIREAGYLTRELYHAPGQTYVGTGLVYV